MKTILTTILILCCSPAFAKIDHLTPKQADWLLVVEAPIIFYRDSAEFHDFGEAVSALFAAERQGLDVRLYYKFGLYYPPPPLPKPLAFRR